MVTLELMEAAVQERMLEATRLQREYEARALQEEGAPVGRERSGLSLRWLPLPRFVAQAFRGAPAA